MGEVKILFQTGSISLIKISRNTKQSKRFVSIMDERFQYDLHKNCPPVTLELYCS